jgi:hypothetical protein
MKLRNIILLSCLISILSCATTIKNSSGYIITFDSNSEYFFRQVFCNDQIAFAWYNIDGFNYLWQVRFDSVKKVYVVRTEGYHYDNIGYREIGINQIIPLDVAEAEALTMAQNAGFNSYSEYAQHHEIEKLLAEEERKRQEIERWQQEQERILEKNRLREEIDNNFGVIAVASMLHAKSGELEIGDIIRLGDTFSYNTNNWIMSNRGGFLFGDYQEFEIIGLDIRQVNVKVIEPNRTGYFVEGGNISAGGRRGYIVRYLGIEDVITQAGLRKVIWVFECIGGNIHAE